MTGAHRPAEDIWSELRRTTQARIGLGRAGNSMPSRRVLEFQAAHAAARDAVHDPLDLDDLRKQLADLDIAPALAVESQAHSRSEYLRRPDLGRRPADVAHLPDTGADIAIVLADGLSPRALTDHGSGLLAALLARLGSRFTLAPPVIATQARVALGDHIGQALGAQTVIMIIGERPGLSVADSLGIYLTHRPRVGLNDADRNCISNIHPPDGLDYDTAAAITAALVDGARKLGRSGVALKDTSRAELPDSAREVLDQS
ncbi:MULTISPECIES: ethanolamine ammonia-lyase subunit EutC [Gordonia]|jgi:ethanolamine ammonia-lyase small subunit|uniref:Ethanolamine ammonia-lyase small subunit n=2 Tax=Gordonia TaxID=2053 RepID=A0A9X3D1Y7_9ACTN|nr:MULTISPECIES: ethanolamine ammonia-lyase subunit EutC [Gordonia]MAU81834.1 ethanolamine ammonia-lyase [Gordonia sp. (in: high G+C Gram-positive bacteria)]MCF3939266.1 ethanolamine ammonia-lyase subunit EutC [Gordonia tangerina]MCX2963347.1 ethanolamine ammonia-lyase subunit EutC [Gordonia aquimaris]